MRVPRETRKPGHGNGHGTVGQKFMEFYDYGVLICFLLNLKDSGNFSQEFEMEKKNKKIKKCVSITLLRKN